MPGNAYHGRMPSRLNHIRLLRYAGLFTWAMVGLPLLMLSRPQDLPPELAEAAAFQLGWQPWLAWAVFGASYAWLTYKLDARRTGFFDYLMLALMTFSAIVISYFSGSGLGSILLMVVACVLPWRLPLQMGIVWLLVSELVIVPVYARFLGLSWTEAVMQSMLYVGFAGFVYVISLVGRQQAMARDDQRRLNSELRATRALLAESVRVNERTRISRELHDLLGHHLTALSLNLEVANHLVQGKAQEHVGQAHTLAKLLLSDVREAVSRLRDDDAIDMRATLLPLADNVPGLRVEMDMPQAFLLDDPERAHVLLRCTQELITNAVRHSCAARLGLHYQVDHVQVVLDASDDGRGAEAAQAGNGLMGMRERLAAYGGTMTITTAPGRGFAVRLCLPLDNDPSAACAPPTAAALPAEPVSSGP